MLHSMQEGAWDTAHRTLMMTINAGISRSHSFWVHSVAQAIGEECGASAKTSRNVRDVNKEISRYIVSQYLYLRFF